MSTSASVQELSPAQIGVLTKAVRARKPRRAAGDEIEIRSVPVRTCYEIMMRLTGPREAVLDYAAYLFAEEGAGPSRPAPPLAIEEAHIDSAAETITLVLSRGSYTPA